MHVRFLKTHRPGQIAIAKPGGAFDNFGIVAPHEVEVSWQALRQVVQDWAGTAAELQEVTPLAGGCVNTTLLLQTRNHHKAVLKITPHRIDRSYADEAHQLHLLRAAGVPVPEVYRQDTATLDSPFSYLLMEFVEGIDLSSARVSCPAEDFDHIQSHLGEIVRQMHEQTSPSYRRVTVSETAPHQEWHAFYRHLFDEIWTEVARSGVLPVKARKRVGKVHDRLDRLIAHADGPKLVHWDLWATNILAAPGPDGRWRIAALLDPHCKFAHAEAEIAYLDLFHTITPAFLDAYHQGRKLAPEYHRVRKPVYQLYSLINHLHLFGHEYLKPLAAAVERVSALI